MVIIVFGGLYFYGGKYSATEIILKTSASGGYQGDVVMAGIANPKKYKEIISKYF
ncbi:MAG: hypothetical protein HY344_00150 [Candidatus Levybacteria bacterium]|nr:hypothetical protein [Candidatus Levybacteria bacterium]